uniref:Zinc finger DHHC-type palmitoyltransferase 4 n=1 Tax=Anas zonorhyncha TaxID=75864 RepID=A0A8B9UI41_9AVES
CVFVCLFVFLEDSRLYLFCFHLPQVLSLVIPTRLQRATQKVLHRLFHTRHLFTVLHVALEVAVYAEYTWEVFPYCWELEFHLLLLLLPYLLLAGNIGCFVLCSRADPGIITKSNHASLMKIYAYDGALFQKGVRCPTCDMEKPARSKHCRKNLTCLVFAMSVYTVSITTVCGSTTALVPSTQGISSSTSSR